VLRPPIGPCGSDIDQKRELLKLAERAGYRLITSQAHPDQFEVYASDETYQFTGAPPLVASFLRRKLKEKQHIKPKANFNL
jgi:hypothetical protein